MNIFKKTTVLIATLIAVASAQAINFDLHSVSASKLSGNYDAPGPGGDAEFIDIRADGEIKGLGADLGYIATLGGNQNTGFWVKVDFNGAPQPELTVAFIKAGSSHLLWDSADLAPFNAGVFTSITLWNDGANGIKNTNGKFQGTSHAGLEGTPGTNVPDGGATAMLLGLGVAGLALARRKLS